MPPSQVSPEYIVKITARKTTVKANWQAADAAIAAAFSPLLSRFNERATKITQMSGSRKKQLAEFLNLVSDVREVASPHIPCTRGCSACCYQRVTMSSTEAELINYKTGHKAARIIAGTSMKPIGEFGAQTPCTFLASNGECSIYEARPYMCRNFVTLDIDSLLCQPENVRLAALKHPAATAVPMLAGGPLDALYLQIVKSDAQADIRTFFPPVA
ncbi:YkgJ family cysteine cluster protein [Achromobacter kerstersii]